MIEVLKQMQEALKKYHYYTIDAGLPNQSMLNKGYAAYQAGKQAIAELESQEQNFCPRCGKRTNDIHTCTPPQCTEQDLSEQGRKKSAILGNNIEEMVNNGLPFLTALDTALKVYDHHTPRLHPPQRTEQEPVAWLLTEKNINSLHVDSIQLLIDRLKHAHHTDLCVRINGQDEWFQADWLKHMVRATPPQRTWVGLTVEEIKTICVENGWDSSWQSMRFAHAIESKLKENNT
jgi:hypothetical protein